MTNGADRTGISYATRGKLIHEAEPILVLTRREGASFVLDLTCDRLALHVPAAPSTTCVITCVPYAVTCERLSTTRLGTLDWEVLKDTGQHGRAPRLARLSRGISRVAD